jgi:hypothetical protein
MIEAKNESNAKSSMESAVAKTDLGRNRRRRAGEEEQK